MNILFIILIGAFVNQNNPPLNSFKWKNRILILHHQEDFFQSMKLKAKELNDRDMIMIHIQNDQLSSFPRTLQIDLKKISEYYDLKNDDPRVILIGKDGGIKLNKSSVMHNQIFDLIDSMPMRQSEMRKKSEK